jgi:hypothetical protein
MAAIQNLEKQFADRAINRHGLKLLRPADAAEYVARCAEHGIEVLGIDGFRVDSESIQPMLEHSVDFSLLPSQGRHHLEATDFLTARLNLDLWFEVVVEKP